jgi:acyl-coenzyme A thioesterase PaaI-like protein
MLSTPVQHRYTDDVSRCYGCGRLNERGLHIQTRWDGSQSVTRFTPEPYHTALAGYVYGGLIASLVDCHGIGTAAAAMADRRKIDLSENPAPRFVTASLHVDYRKPAPIDGELMLTGSIREITDRKAVVSVQLTVDGELCAEGTVVAVELRDGA